MTLLGETSILLDVERKQQHLKACICHCFSSDKFITGEAAGLRAASSGLLYVSFMSAVGPVSTHAFIRADVLFYFHFCCLPIT